LVYYNLGGQLTQTLNRVAPESRCARLPHHISIIRSHPGSMHRNTYICVGLELGNLRRARTTPGGFHVGGIRQFMDMSLHRLVGGRRDHKERVSSYSYESTDMCKICPMRNGDTRYMLDDRDKGGNFVVLVRVVDLRTLPIFNPHSTPSPPPPPQYIAGCTYYSALHQFYKAAI